MALFSAHTSLGIFLWMVVTAALVAIGVPVLAALAVSALASWALVQTVFKRFADRAEHWLTTPK